MHTPPPPRGTFCRASTAALAVALALLFPTTPVRAQAVALRVVANGQAVSLRGNAIIQDNVVMAPYQGLFGPLGIRAEWAPRSQTLTLVSPAGDEMQLRPNDPYATVNGERRPIPIPLVSVLGRVLIPVQWVFDTLGDITTYDAATRTVTISPQITGINWRAAGESLEVQIDATAPVHARAVRLHGPDRVVVEVDGAVAKLPQPTFDVHEGPLSTIAITALRSGTEIVLTTEEPVRFWLAAVGTNRGAILTLTPGGLQGPSGPATPANSSEPRIMSIAYQHVDGGGRLLITSTRPLQITQHVLRAPDRVVLDAPNAVFVPIKQTLDVNDGLVIQVRAAQFHKAPDIVRVVVELAHPIPFDVQAGSAGLDGAMETMVGLGAAAGRAPEVPGARGPVVVAIDPGHGGSDPGAIGPNGVREKDVALAIARNLRTLLVEQHIDTVMVRDGDEFVPLDDRASIAQRGGATLFLSIHANASVDATANGVQTFYYTRQSVPLARAVLEEVARAVNLTPRGVTQARFEVLLDNPQIPAILVETAFITNRGEERMLRDPRMQQSFALGILKGIQQYLAAQQSGAP